MNIQNMPNAFPKKLITAAIDLEVFTGVKELAWKKNDAINVANILCKLNHAILGGDVYALRDGIMRSTGDNWFMIKEKQTWQEFVINSKDHTLNYINKYYEYYERNGDEPYYSIITCPDELYYLKIE